MGLPVLTSQILRPEILFYILNALARSHSGNHVALDVKDGLNQGFFAKNATISFSLRIIYLFP